MDLSALLGQDGGGDLNDELSAMTASGESVFTSPFGDTTSFRREDGGVVRCTFFFNPRQEYKQDAILASVSGSYKDFLQEAVSKAILTPEQRAPTKPPKELIVWLNISKNLPNEVLAKNVFSDKDALEEYKKLITDTALAAHNEGEHLLKALQTSTFCCVFELAIDAFTEKSETADTMEPRGVLTIRIDGLTAKDAEASEPTNEKTKEVAEGQKSPSRRKRGKSQMAEEAKEEAVAAALMSDLRMGVEHRPEGTHMLTFKEVPESADELFDMISKWISSMIAKRGAKLQSSLDRNPLYQ